MIDFPSIDYIVQVELDVIVTNKISSTGQQCSDQTNAYDSCIQNMNIKSMLEKCSLPFLNMNQTRKSTVCANFTDGLEALAIFQRTPENCKPSCSEIMVRANLLPVDLLYPTLNPNSPTATSYTGYLFRIPTKVLSSTMIGTYSIVSLIAEFGGWMGLLLGISLLSLWDQGWDMCEAKFKIPAILKLTSTLLVYLVSLVCIGIIFGRALGGMLYKETGLDVNIEAQISDLSISFCSMENVYLNQRSVDGKTELVYVGNQSTMWNHDLKLRSKMESLNVVLRNGTNVEIYYEHNNMSRYILYSTNIPRFNNYIENCHTLDLQFGAQIKSLELTARKEFSIYIHKTGQLLNMDFRQGLNYINRQSLEKVVSYYLVYGSRLKIGIETLNLDAGQPEVTVLTSTFDDCVLKTLEAELGRQP